MALSIMKKTGFTGFSFFESVNFPVLGSKLGYFWTIFKGFGDIIDGKYMFYLSNFNENFRMNFIWSENVNSDVKLKTLYSFESQSNQNDLTHFVDLLVQFSII